MEKSDFLIAQITRQTTFKKKKDKNFMLSIVKTYGGGGRGIPERIQSLKLYFLFQRWAVGF
jgi:hypothetical protein